MVRLHSKFDKNHLKPWSRYTPSQKSYIFYLNICIATAVLSALIDPDKSVIYGTKNKIKDSTLNRVLFFMRISAYAERIYRFAVANFGKAERISKPSVLSYGYND